MWYNESKRGHIQTNSNSFQHKAGRIFLSLLLTGVFVSPIRGGVQAATSSITDLQKQKSALEQKIKDDQAAQKKKQDEQQKLNKQIGDLDGQITGIQKKVQDTNANIQTTEDAITQKETEKKAKEAELAQEQAKQDETLRVIYVNGHQSTLEALVNSSSLSDYLTYQQYLDSLDQRIQQRMTEITQIKADIEQKEQDLEHRKSELTDLRAQQQAYQKALDGQLDQKKQLLADAKSVEKKLAQQVADAQKVYSDVNNELTKLQEAARRLAAQRGHGQIPPGVSQIGFQWPTAFMYISTPFGGRTPFQSFHTGVDLVNYAGTEVVAAADGVVTHIGQVSYGYGNHVIISHNERYATLYGHFMAFADGLAEGQTVKRGQVIGYMGTTGWSTGPHLHFEVRDYGVPVDPMDYMP